MGMSVGGSNRGIFVEMNVVPLIDVLLVLQVIFYDHSAQAEGLMAELPQPRMRFRWIRDRRQSSFKCLPTDRCASIKKRFRGTG